MGFPSFSGLVCGFMRVVGSTVVGRHSAVLIGGEGQIGGLDDTTDPDAAGQRMDDAEMYSALGVIARPRPPETIDGDILGHESMYLELGGIQTPIAHRDLRLNRKFPAPKPGTVALVGYGGAFLSFDDTDALESRATFYVPFAFVDGVATKAHMIQVDPESNAINILHADGAQFTLLPDKEIMAVADNDTWWQMKPGVFNVQAEQIALVGSVYIGNPTLAVPLLAGAASQPSTRLNITTP